MSVSSIGFKGVQHYGDPLLMSEVESNLQQWLEWSFLKIGAWTPVTANTSGVYGGRFDVLLPLDDNNYDDYEPTGNIAFFAIRKDWVHESNVGYESPEQSVASVTYSGNAIVSLDSYEQSRYSPGDTITLNNDALSGDFTVLSGDGSTIHLSGVNSGDLSPTSGATGGTIFGTYDPPQVNVYRDTVLVPTGEYTVDYPNGKVYFNNPVSTSVEVTADYCYRNVQVYTSDEAPAGFEIQADSLDPSNISWANAANSGEFATDPTQRAQLPAVMVEAVARKTSTGYQLGSGQLRLNQDVQFTVVSQNKYERNLITDILCQQKHRNLRFFDTDQVVKKNAMPLTFDGDINPSGLSYTGIAADNDLYWSHGFIEDAFADEIVTNSPELHMSKVRYKIEVIR